MSWMEGIKNVIDFKQNSLDLPYNKATVLSARKSLVGEEVRGKTSTLGKEILLAGATLVAGALVGAAGVAILSAFAVTFPVSLPVALAVGAVAGALLAVTPGALSAAYRRLVLSDDDAPAADPHSRTSLFIALANKYNIPPGEFLNDMNKVTSTDVENLLKQYENGTVCLNSNQRDILKDLLGIMAHSKPSKTTSNSRQEGVFVMFNLVERVKQGNSVVLNR